MRISRKAEYALRALFALARVGPGRLLQIQELSEQERIPLKFLEQILLVLKREGLLTSKRGVGGGYQLRRSTGAVTVGQVLRLIDGPLAPVPCAADRPVERCSCPDPSTCPLRSIMRRVRQEAEGVLEGLTLEQAAEEGREPGGLAFEI